MPAKSPRRTPPAYEGPTGALPCGPGRGRRPGGSPAAPLTFALVVGRSLAAAFTALLTERGRNPQRTDLTAAHWAESQEARSVCAGASAPHPFARRWVSMNRGARRTLRSGDREWLAKRVHPHAPVSLRPRGPAEAAAGEPERAFGLEADRPRIYGEATTCSPAVLVAGTSKLPQVLHRELGTRPGWPRRGERRASSGLQVFLPMGTVTICAHRAPEVRP